MHVVGKRKAEGLSESSKKKKKGHQVVQSENVRFCVKCHSSHKWPRTSDPMSCRRCGKLGHKQEVCKNESLYYNCRHTGHMSGYFPNSKVQVGGSGKMNDAPKV